MKAQWLNLLMLIALSKSLTCGVCSMGLRSQNMSHVNVQKRDMCCVNSSISPVNYDPARLPDRGWDQFSRVIQWFGQS